MNKMLLLSIWLFSVTRCEDPKIQVSGQEGGQVHISCPYDSGYESYPKYFMKGIYAYRKAVIKTNDKQDGKYDLYDDTKKRILHVTIYNLNLQDAGTYWCEIDAYTFDPKTEVELKVHKARTPGEPIVETITMNPKQSTRTTVSVSGTAVWSTPSDDKDTAQLSRKELYLGVTAAAVLLVLLAILVAILRNYRLDTTDIMVYFTSTCHSHLRSQIQPDSLFFSNLSFGKVTDCSTDAVSTIKHQTTDEPTVCFNF